MPFFSDSCYDCKMKWKNENTKCLNLSNEMLFDSKLTKSERKCQYFLLIQSSTILPSLAQNIWIQF